MAGRSDSTHTGTPRAGLCGRSCRPWCGWGWGTHPAGSWGCQLGTVIGSHGYRGTWTRGEVCSPEARGVAPGLGWTHHTGSLLVTEALGWAQEAAVTHCTDGETEVHQLPSLPQTITEHGGGHIGTETQDKWK